VIEELREMYPTLMHLIREDDSKNNNQFRIDSNTNEVLVADLIAKGKYNHNEKNMFDE
jgi:hypothetical protein